MNNKSFKLKLIFSLVASCLVFSGLIVFGWSEPTDFPPADNVAAPLNTGSSGQSKSSGLWLNTGGADVGLIVEHGKVGIGTVDPSQSLHVDGSMRLTGAFYDGNNSAGTSGQALVSTGTGVGWSDVCVLVEYTEGEGTQCPSGRYASSVGSATPSGYILCCYASQ
jgi:hypothetical protein